MFIAATLLQAAMLATPLPQEWAGTLTFFDENLKTANVPLNMSLTTTVRWPKSGLSYLKRPTTTTTCSIAFYFVKDYTHPDCNLHTEEGLQWSTDITTSPPTATASGNGVDPDKYYSFKGTLIEKATTNDFVWNGTIFYYHGKATKATVGTFTLAPTSTTNKQKPPNCIPGPPSPSPAPPSPSPSPPPPPPPSPLPDQLPVWPLPTTWTAGNDIKVLDGTQFVFRYAKPSATPKTLLQAFDRYSTLIRPHRPMPAASDGAATLLQSLVVSVADPSEAPPQQGTNESYTLVVPGDGDGGVATLDAATVYGALRGLETFSQLVLFNFTTATYTVAGVPLTVVDEPRFTHRGFMVDTSRHYLSLSLLYQLLDSMSYAKLNVLHWHVVDDQSFPLEVRSFPRLQGMGAFSARERYTQLDAADLVEYARLRGIRVMLEIDTPSHTACWCRGYPKVCPPKRCKDGTTRTPLDPSNNDTFSMIQTIFEELTPIFPEQLLHVGQDEVDVGCWESAQNPTIGAWKKQHGFKTGDEAYVYTANRIEDGVRSLATPKTAVQWWPGLCLGATGQPWISPCRGVINNDGSQPTPGLDKSTVLQLWNDPKQPAWNDTLVQVVAAGFKVIQTQGWYENAQYLTVNWTDFYMNEPMAGVTKASEQQLILGGEAAMWGEMIDGSALLNSVWPRAAATAERLWSPRHVDNVVTAKQRLAKFRCLLLERGVPAGPLDFGGKTSGKNKAGQPPTGPGSCSEQ